MTIPLRRLDEPEELVPLDAHLASDFAAFVTGAVVVGENDLMNP
jgi:NAD(P)-dependent dehydrogenase (short-subunit alcohol dehydrogenase family)